MWTCLNFHPAENLGTDDIVISRDSKKLRPKNGLENKHLSIPVPQCPHVQVKSPHTYMSWTK